MKYNFINDASLLLLGYELLIMQDDFLDCSMETQRVIVRLTKLHESVLSAIEKLGKLNWEASEAAKRETVSQ